MGRPEHATAGTPSSVAEPFAHDAPGWNQATANETEQGTCVTLPERNTEVCSENAKTVTLAQPGLAPSK